MNEIKIFTGNSNPKLATLVADNLGLPLGHATVGKFSDGEINVEIKENVRGKDTFIIQSTCNPSNDTLMEIIIMADALRRASVNSITAVMPYFGYARQDRRVRSSRVPITAKVVADMLSKVGITRLVTVDLHADQIQGFFYMPVDNIYASAVMLDDIKHHEPSKTSIVSPDIGGVVRARAVAKRLDDCNLAIIDKRRPSPNESQVMNIIGDIAGRNCIIIDDIIDTAGTMSKAADALKEKGALSVRAYCTHPVLSGQALDNINNSCIDELVVTDTIPLAAAAKKCTKIRQIGLSHLIAETLRRVHSKESVSEMFSESS